MSSSASPPVLALALAGLVAVGATACTAQQEASPSESAAAGVPVAIDCDTLITPEALADYSPGFSLDDAYTPADGSEAAEVAKLDGLTCSWINQTSGMAIEVAVAQLPDADLTALKNEFVTESNSVPTYRVEGYFELVDDSGQADAFDDPYWITASSTAFLEPGDAEAIIAAAIAGLG
jgi:hypothetical protein